nr:vinorine synthase-like [Tanacetum cinerariifolium]
VKKADFQHSQPIKASPQMLSNTINMECSMSTSRLINATKSEEWLENSSNIERDNKKVDLENMSGEIIKPASLTPHQLKTFNLSISDQSISQLKKW